MKKLLKFNKLSIVSIIILIILTLVLIALNTLTHPHVVGINVIGGAENAKLKNQQIRIEFNRPINRDTVTNSIEITPKADFRSLWSGNNLILAFDTSLDSQTDYTLTLKKNITDIYNEEFTEDYIFHFKTEIPRLAVIEKVHDNTTNTIAIYNANLAGRQELLKRDNIQFYGLNETFLVVVTESNYTNNIELINRVTNEVQNFNLNNVRINSFAFSPTRNEFAYAFQEVEVEQNYYIPISDAKVIVYDIDARSQIDFNPQNSADDVVYLEYSNDGNSLLYRSSDSFYTLAEIKRQDNFTGIGRYLWSGNFNKDSDKIIFLTFDPASSQIPYQFISTFSSEREIINITDGFTAVLDPVFMNKTDLILFAQKHKDLDRTKGIYKIMQTDLSGNSVEVISNEKYSLELPLPSPDDRYIAIEKYNEINLLNFTNARNYGFQNKPQLANIIVFDTVENKLYDTNLIAVEAKWI